MLHCVRENGSAKTQILQERWGANAGRTVVRLPAPHFPAPKGGKEAWKFGGLDGVLSVASQGRSVAVEGLALWACTVIAA